MCGGNVDKSNSYTTQQLLIIQLRYCIVPLRDRAAMRSESVMMLMKKCPNVVALLDVTGDRPCRLFAIAFPRDIHSRELTNIDIVPDQR